MVWDGVVLFYSERHLYHSGGRGEEIRGVETAGRVMVVSWDDGVAVEIQISGVWSLLPGLKKGHALDSVLFLPLLETSHFQGL